MNRYLSLGWGVQSFTLAAMAAVGELELTAAVHADTLHEMAATYAFAARWAPWLAERGVPIVTVRGADHRRIAPQVERYGAVPIPAAAVNARGGLGRLNRHCTQDWKVRPIERHIRAEIGRGARAELVLGVSYDEATRMRSSQTKFLEHAYPLVDRGMTRADCVAWLRARGLEVPPKSACTFCPYHGRRAWVALIDNGGPDLADAVAVDELIRNARPYPVYVHPSGRPLASIVTPKRIGARQGEMFAEDESLGPCEGGYCHA